VQEGSSAVLPYCRASLLQDSYCRTLEAGAPQGSQRGKGGKGVRGEGLH